KRTIDNTLNKAIKPDSPCSNEQLFYASDICSEALEAARKNADLGGVGKMIHWERRNFFTLRQEDVFRLHPVSGKDRFLVLNPPYGKRLEIDAPFYKKLFYHLQKHFSHWKILVLLPTYVHWEDFPLSPCKHLVFRHGGLRIQALVLEPD
ncbi:MAG: hypothetical protein SNJ78_05745, partial [Spirochaetales bacterium]